MKKQTAATSIVLLLFLIASGSFILSRQSLKDVKETEVLGEALPLPTEKPNPSIEQTITPTPSKEFVSTPTVSPTSTTTIIITPLPTAEPILSPTTATGESPREISANSGKVVTISYKNLQKNTLYKISVGQYPSSALSLSWPITADLLWSTNSTVTKSQLEDVPHDEDSQGIEFNRYSGLLSYPSQGYLYVYPTESISKLTVALIQPSEQTTNFSTLTTGVYNSDSGASYTSLPIITRDEWGANPASWDSNSSADIDDPSRLIWYPVYYKAARIVVHHTASTPNSTNPAASVRAIYLYHSYVREWRDIGYNYLIDQNGTIYEGKLGGDETQGYHAFGAANRMSIGISLIGDFTSTTPTTKTRSSLVKLMAEKAAFYGFTLKYSDGGVTKWKDSSYTVFGHRTSYQWSSSSNSWSVNQTACPGNAFFPQLGSVVQEAENYRRANFTQLKQLALDTNNSFAQPHEIGTIVVRYKVPESTTPQVMQSYVPKFSGITSYTIEGNTITYRIESTIVTHPNNDTEYLVVPMGWTGYDGEYSTFSTPIIMNGPEDRAKTLLKIFKLDPRVEAADINHYLSVPN